MKPLIRSLKFKHPVGGRLPLVSVWCACCCYGCWWLLGTSWTVCDRAYIARTRTNLHYIPQKFIREYWTQMHRWFSTRTNAVAPLLTDRSPCACAGLSWSPLNGKAQRESYVAFTICTRIDYDAANFWRCSWRNCRAGHRTKCNNARQTFRPHRVYHNQVFVLHKIS